MDATLISFVFLAASIGFIHTLLGPDHYLPFIALSKAGHWSLRKTLWITLLCGVGHVLSSVVLGGLGISFGWMIGELVAVESHRGEIAGWLLLSFGILYFVWGLKKGIRGGTHHHHFYESSAESKKASSTTPWMLFLIFIFGPCEPLIPVLMYPAVQKDTLTLLMVVVVFAIVTLSTMATIVLVGYQGLSFVKLHVLERWTHALAGGAISIVAAGMVFAGW